MANELSNKYFVRKSTTDAWEDITTKFAGCKILKMDGFNELGDAVNVYNEQWVGSQTEDFLVTTQDGQGNNVIVRKNVDIQMTLIISRRYSPNIDEQTVFDSVADYFCGHGDLYIKSAYVNKQAHVICLKAVKPTAQDLHRGNRSYILATVELHTLEKPTTVSQPTMTAVQTPTGNPKSNGYYERNGTSTEYRLTWDSSVVQGKTYYILA